MTPKLTRLLCSSCQPKQTRPTAKKVKVQLILLRRSRVFSTNSPEVLKSPKVKLSLKKVNQSSIKLSTGVSLTGTFSRQVSQKREQFLTFAERCKLWVIRGRKRLTHLLNRFLPSTRSYLRKVKIQSVPLLSSRKEARASLQCPKFSSSLIRTKPTLFTSWWPAKIFRWSYLLSLWMKLKSGWPSSRDLKNWSPSTSNRMSSLSSSAQFTRFQKSGQSCAGSQK